MVEYLKQVFDYETKWLFTTWSLKGGGRLREVVARKALTITSWIVASQINGLTFSHLILLVVEAVKYDVFGEGGI